MKNRNWLLLLLCLTASPLYAVTVDTVNDTGHEPVPYQDDDSTNMGYGTVYDNTTYVEWKTYFTDSFTIKQAGTYHVYLDDLDEAAPLVDFGADVTAGKGYYFGFKRGEGSFSFEAKPGEYDINIWAKADYETRMGEFNVRIAKWDMAPVPVPAAAWLFSSGLLGLIGLSRRKAA